ncbi:MAG: SMP-30/gluconolactonase/LRE family protein [Betaproteobacteria bacterium]|jgi:sugar lactone lactonase YvrE
MTQFGIFSNHKDQVGESPVWDAEGLCLWWVDIESQCIRKKSLEGQLQSWHLPEKVGCIALTANRQVVAAMETSIALLSLESDGRYKQQTLATMAHPKLGMRFNDGRCDPSGRMWIGTMVMDMGKAENAGGLYCLDERGLTGPYVEGLYTPNGLAFSPDGGTMYFSDSHPMAQKIWRCQIELASGNLSNQSLFVDMTDLQGRPDGAAMDAQGHYWICGNDAGLVHCFDTAGRCIESLSVPFPKPAMCAFGGVDLQTMFVTSIVPGNKALDTTGQSGQVVSAHLPHRGLPEPVFSRFPATWSSIF